MSTTNVPLFISTEQGELLPCAANGENCGFWASGCLRVETPETDSRPSSGVVILTMAGCSVCDVPYVTNQDIDVIGQPEGFRDLAPEDMPAAAAQTLAQRAQTFLPERPAAG